jgi:hypothetical protein
MADIQRAYDEVLLDIAMHSERPQLAFNYTRRRPHHIIPRERSYSSPPRLVRQYEPMIPQSDFHAKEKLVMLTAFEATYHDTTTPLTPDMVPLIIDTGASISLTPHATDFITPIRPVQNIQIKGIASGLSVKGVGDISYQFRNDMGELQTMILRDCLYVPQCVVRLLCPRQIGAETKNPEDGFNAKHINPVLTVNGKQTTIKYDSLSQLQLLFTAPGITSYQRYAQFGCTQATPTKTLNSNRSYTFTRHVPMKVFGI